MCTYRSFLPKKNQLFGRRTIARTESHGRTERWCLPLSRVGYCNAALAPLAPLSFPLASPFLVLSLCSPRWATSIPHSSPPPTRLPPRDHRRLCTSILCDSPFSIYFPWFAPRSPLQMSPRGRLTFALAALLSLSLSLPFSLLLHLDLLFTAVWLEGNSWPPASH